MKKPEPGSADWWQEVSQGLGIKLFDLRGEVASVVAGINQTLAVNTALFDKDQFFSLKPALELWRDVLQQALGAVSTEVCAVDPGAAERPQEVLRATKALSSTTCPVEQERQEGLRRDLELQHDYDKLATAARAVVAEFKSNSEDDRYSVRLAVSISRLKHTLSLAPPVESARQEGCTCYPWDGIHAVDCPASPSVVSEPPRLEEQTEETKSVTRTGDDGPRHG